MGTDPDGGGPATDFGCDSFATIQGGVDGVTNPGTVLVSAGTYNEAQILVQKALTITGAGAATTIINGGNTPIASAGLVRIDQSVTLMRPVFHLVALTKRSVKGYELN